MTKIRADRVKRLREERGLSQGQLATYGGMSQSYISDIESGKRPNVGGGKLVGGTNHLPVGTLDKKTPLVGSFLLPTSFGNSRPKWLLPLDM